MEWLWDSRKAAANVAKHDVLFETAAAALDDAFLISEPDLHPDDDRWRTIARLNVSTFLIVHTAIDEHGAGRIISARKANSMERKAYENQFH